MKMMMMNCFCRMVDPRKAFSLISSRNHCQRSYPSRISDTPRAGFEPAQNLSSGLLEWSCCSSDNHYTMAPHLIHGRKLVLIWNIRFFSCSIYPVIQTFQLMLWRERIFYCDTHHSFQQFLPFSIGESFFFLSFF